MKAFEKLVKSEPEIESLNEQDKALLQAIDYLHTNWFSEDVGLVAACLSIPGTGSFCATSKQHQDGRWIHAEQNLLELIARNRITNLQSGILAVTLSPCTSVNSESRYGSSCVELLSKHKIRNVHCGALDSYQRYDQSSAKNRVFSFTSHPALKRTCYKLLKMLREIPNELGVSIQNAKMRNAQNIFDDIESLHNNVLNYSIQHR